MPVKEQGVGNQIMPLLTILQSANIHKQKPGRGTLMGKMRGSWVSRSGMAAFLIFILFLFGSCGEDLKAANENLKKEVADLSAENERLKGETQRLRTDLTALHSQVAELNMKVSSLQQENQSLQKEVETAKKRR